MCSSDLTAPDLGELAAYDYHLPEDRIAKQPTERRDQARLLVLDRATQTIRHHHVADLPNLLRSNDRIVLNDTKVLPARVLGKRVTTGGKWEGLYLESGADGEWHLMSQTRGHLRPDELVSIESIHHPELAPLHLRMCERLPEGLWSARSENNEPAEIGRAHV